MSSNGNINSVSSVYCLDPVVLKGIIVRNLYPMPMLRPSVDEDILVPVDDVKTYHDFFLSEGLTLDDSELNLNAQELSYHKENSPTYIELHTKLFPDESEAYGSCNALFEGVLDRTVTVQIEDVTVRTLAPTDHLLYLICHAYKHFLHSGVGIRQICDIGMFTKAYNSEIDWKHIREACESIRIQKFTAALFRITEKYLGFEMLEAFADIEVDETDLLEDIMSGGVYGNADINRMHSSNITLDAVAADRAGKKRGGLWHSVFLPLNLMEGRFPYLKKYCWLLPVAWIQRVWIYLFKQKDAHNNAAESIRIGNSRVELLREYGIIEK